VPQEGIEPMGSGGFIATLHSLPRLVWQAAFEKNAVERGLDAI
jgi:hypothetical protein